MTDALDCQPAAQPMAANAMADGSAPASSLLVTSAAVRRRIVVFTSNLSYTVRRNVVELDHRMGPLDWLIVVASPRRTLGQIIKSQRVNLRRNGWRWIALKAAEMMQRFEAGGPDRPVTPTKALPGDEYEAAQWGARPNLKLCHVDDLHAAPTLQRVRDFAPDLGLSLAAPILKRPLFGIPRLGTINLHKGRLPEFRGMPPAFWELWNDQSSVGCSVHWVDDGLDTGALLGQAELPRQRWSTVRGLQLGLDELGVDLVCSAVQDVLSGRDQSTPQPAGAGKTYRKPTLRQQSELTRRLDSVQPRRAAPWKRLLKDVAARSAFAFWHSIGWRLLTPRITILLYHRVCDDARDNLSVGVEQFERQMQLLVRNCDVVGIDQVIATRSVPRSRRPLVAITFDDGYLDNYENAAPILRRHRLPCAFFVSTGVVDSDRPFPHDIRRGNGVVPVMNWDQLRRMRSWGFTIGSHTVEHIDCVAEGERRVREELTRSRDDLVRELGPLEPIFAYPYGGRHQMNAERLELVREAGYVSCLAAYGGSNVGTVDRWNVLRRGVHWEFSDSAFLWHCVGLR